MRVKVLRLGEQNREETLKKCPRYERVSPAACFRFLAASMERMKNG
jgi:hypothetical protein